MLYVLDHIEETNIWNSNIFEVRGIRSEQGFRTYWRKKRLVTISRQ